MKDWTRGQLALLSTREETTSKKERKKAQQKLISNLSRDKMFLEFLWGAEPDLYSEFDKYWSETAKAGDLPSDLLEELFQRYYIWIDQMNMSLDTALEHFE